MSELEQMQDYEDKCYGQAEEANACHRFGILDGCKPDCPVHGSSPDCPDYTEEELEDNIHLGSNFDDFYIEALQEYTKMLEQKLKDIECGECTKNMLECKCEDT